jgi:hypothetical protein
MGKTYKDLKKQGKHVFDGPEVKQRKNFAPATKTEKPKKGKGSYNRGNAFDEDEESGDDKRTKRIKQAESMGYKKLPQHDAVWTHKGMKIYGVNNLPPLKDEKNDEDEEKACWKGYEKKGTKKKGGKTVNNCVKESTDLSKFIEAIMTNDHAQAHKQLKDAVNFKIQQRIAQEIDNPLF